MKALKIFIIIHLLSGSMSSQVIFLENQVFTHDTVLSGKKIVFRKNAVIRVKNAAVVSFIADTIEVETTCLVDGRGEDGAAGGNLPEWKSGQSGSFWTGDERHKQWEDAGHGGHDIGIAGSPGTDGAKITIVYKVRGGISGSLAGLVCKTDGGKGGAGGPGRTLICGDCGKQKMGDHYGAQGANGKDGYYHQTQN